MSEENTEGNSSPPPTPLVPETGRGRLVVATPDTMRMSQRPPMRFSSGADLELWLKRFELYARQTSIPDAQWSRELISLLEDEPFRVVVQLALLESTDYSTVVETLRHQFSAKGNELEWQHRLQTRTQGSGEQLVEYAGALRVLADKAYPSWSSEQRQEVLRNQFIQGIASPSVQLRLMRDMPGTLDDALKLAIQLQTVEAAQKRLHQDMHSSKDALVVQQTSPVDTNPEPMNAVYYSDNRPSADASRKIQELTKEVQRLSDELVQMKERQFQPQQRVGTRRGVTNFSGSCWSCGEPGHVRRNCPTSRGRGRGRRQGTMENAATNNSTLVVDGFIGGRRAKMLVDSGSAVSILHQDVWRECTATTTESQLDIAVPPVVAANGGALNILGHTSLVVEVAGLKAEFSFLVAEKLTQECILGADFLHQHKCIIDLSNQVLKAGGAAAALESNQEAAPSVCHVTFPHTTVLPGNTEVQLPLQLSKCCHTGTAILEPALTFMERHGILIAHSLTYTGPQQEKAMVRILNPSPASVVVYQNEKVGVLCPCEEPEEICTLTASERQDGYPGGTRDIGPGIKQAIAQLIPNDMDLPPNISEGLGALLHEFSDVISTGDSDLGRTTLTQHRINTGDATPICQPPRRLAPCQREEAQKLVHNMLKQGVVEAAQGPWSSPIVLVKKKDGSTRFCVDFRKLNAHTKRDAHPIPRVDDTLDTLGQAEWFSTLDLA